MIKNLFTWLTKHSQVTLGGLLVLFSAIVLGNMTRWSIWFDEAFSAYIVRFNYVEITQYTAADVHPPLYYWVLNAWTSLWGTSELAFRSLSLVFSIVAIIGIYYLVRRLFDSTNYALIAAGAVALSPMLIRFSHEARMYTMVLAIVVAATYVLVRVTETGSRKLWALYGVLLALGMLTHYFVAFAWLGHWAWRYYEVRAKRLKQFWTKPWVLAHVVAIVLFLPWVPLLINQLITVQAGFWIGQISAYTPIDYLSNALLYRQYGTVQHYYAIAFWVAIIISGLALYRMRRYAVKAQHSGFALLAIMATVPPLLVVIISLPPFSSTFIDRYFLPSSVFLIILVALSLARLWNKQRRFALYSSIFLVAALITGIANVYYYGNYNKNSNYSIRTSQVIEQIDTVGQDGQPIIAASPWLYYEAAFYDSPEHHVYFIDKNTTYQYGSLDMLKNSDTGKIKDLDAFTKLYPKIWYMDTNSDEDVTPPVSSWKRIKTVRIYDSINDNEAYRASLFDTSAE